MILIAVVCLNISIRNINSIIDFSYEFLLFKNLAPALLTNHIGEHCHHLNASANGDARDRMLGELMVHMSFVRPDLKNTPVMQPLIHLMDNPAHMQVSDERNNWTTVYKAALHIKQL